MGGGAAAPASRAANWASEKSGEEILRCAGKNFSGLCGGPLKLLVLEIIDGVVFSVQKIFPAQKDSLFFFSPFHLSSNLRTSWSSYQMSCCLSEILESAGFELLKLGLLGRCLIH